MLLQQCFADLTVTRRLLMLRLESGGTRGRSMGPKRFAVLFDRFRPPMAGRSFQPTMLSCKFSWFCELLGHIPLNSVLILTNTEQEDEWECGINEILLTGAHAFQICDWNSNTAALGWHARNSPKMRSNIRRVIVFKDSSHNDLFAFSTSCNTSCK